MIVGLRGRVVSLEVGGVVIDVGGVFYGVSISYLSGAKITVGEEVQIFVTEIIREDAYLLFGFLQKEEQRIFERLIKINGVGPKVAMAILSTYTPQNFAQIIEQKNISALQRVSGIGAKGASKIMVDLAGFFDFEVEKSADQKARDEATLALESLGFKKGEIANAMKGVCANETAQIIKEALKNLQNI